MIDLILVLKTISNKATKTILCGSTRPPYVVNDYLLTSDKLDLCNNFVNRVSDYIGRFCINYPIQCAFGLVSLGSDLLNKVTPWKKVVQLFRILRNLGLNKSKLKQSISKKKINQNQKKIK